MPWPAGAAERDRFVLARRSSRPAHDPWRYQGLLVEEERAADGTVVGGATVFLTGRECPWRCAMCDLWTYTTTAETPLGALPAQVSAALTALGVARPSMRQIKLYNASSFFDPRAVPEADYDALAALVQGFERVIVESHPSLIGPRVERFLDALAGPWSSDTAALRCPGRPGVATTGRAAFAWRARTATRVRLEVAMGLETAHPEALKRLHKRMSVDTFRVAARWLQARELALRVFLLIAPPFIPPSEQDAWLLYSIEEALACGATAVSLIATRPGNGALQALAAEGLFAAPQLPAIERSFDAALAHVAGRARVFLDLWDLDRTATCSDCRADRRARLHAMNLAQQILPAVECARCAVSMATA